MHSFLLRSAWGLGLGAWLAGPALALGNGTFDADLAGWTLGGDVAWQGGTVVLTTAYDDTDDGGVNFNLSGTAPLAAGADLEALAGLPAGALDGTVAAYEGSVITQAFSVAAGDRLQFDWRLLSNDGAMPDVAFVSFGPASSITVLAEAGQASAGGAALGYAAGTGWASFSQTFASAGTYTLVLGVADRGDFIASSALQVDNILLSPVPEGDGLLLAGLGVGLLGWQRRAGMRRLVG